MPQARAVFFDVGETLLDESAGWGAWADWLGVPRHTFSAVFGAVLARGEDHRRVFQHFRPGFDLAAERRRRAAAGLGEHLTEADLYPDARPCLRELRDRGFVVGIAGNQTAEAERLLRDLELPADIIGTSASWGAGKPSAAFFERLVSEAGCPAGEIVHVGDRLDNDIRPALAAGLQTALVRRGPWAFVQAGDPDVPRAHLRVDSLAELPRLLRLASRSPER